MRTIDLNFENSDNLENLEPGCYGIHFNIASIIDEIPNIIPIKLLLSKQIINHIVTSGYISGDNNLRYIRDLYPGIIIERNYKKDAKSIQLVCKDIE